MGAKVTNCLPRGLKKSPEGWIIDKVVRGVRIKKRLGGVSRSQAEEAFLDLVNSARTYEYSPARAGSLTVRDALNRWYEDHLRGMKSEARKFLFDALDRHLGHIPVMSLSKRHVDGYVRSRLRERKKIYHGKGKETTYGKPVTVRTVRHELSELKMAVRFLRQNGDIPRNPLDPDWFKTSELKLPRQKKIILDYGLDLGPEFLVLYHHITAKWHWKLFYLALYETGMRPGELKMLRTSWLSEVAPGLFQIKVPPSAEKTENDDRRIPVSPRLAKRLMPLVGSLPADSLVFESPRFEGKPLRDHKRQFQNARKLSGLGSEITPYALRKTRATFWSSIDDLASRVALGHAPIDPHEKSYVAVTPKRLFRLVGKEIKTRDSLRVLRRKAG